MRAFLRHPSDISIECRAADGELVRGQPAKDVGAGGLCFRSSYDCEPGERVAVRITACDPPFEAVGTVVWCRPSGGCYEVGVRFEGGDAQFALRMAEQVCQIEHYRMEVREREGRSLTSDEAALEWIARRASRFPRDS